MDAFLFSANAVLPIILLIALGWLLKKLNILSDEFLNVGNKLTFRVFLPVLLFYNVYGIESFAEINWGFVLYAVCATLVIFGLAVGAVVIFTKDNARRGVLIQAIFRSNYAIIGIPLATMLFGERGAAAASVLSAFSIPLFNVLAVVTLSVFNGKGESADSGEISPKPTAKSVVLGIITNPLILGVAAGMVTLGIRAIFVANNVTFRLAGVGFLYTAIKYVAACATPFALIVLGGKFQFAAVAKLWKPIVLGTVLRTVVVPTLALVAAYFLLPDLGGEHFAAYVALFGTPVAVSSAIMAKEMGGEQELAGQLVVWTTIVSAFTIFVTVVVFRACGVF